MNNFVSIGNRNTKLGMSIPNINLPACTTCRPDAPCFKECYARKGNFTFANVKKALEGNYSAFCSNPTLYFDEIRVRTNLNRYVRWHSSGDIPNSKYLEGMCRVARKNKGTNYLCFTKKFELVNDYISSGHRIPKNLSIVFSNWKNWQCENPYNLPTAWVEFPKEENTEIPETAVKCSGKCAECQYCWHMKNGQSVYFPKH